MIDLVLLRERPDKIIELLKKKDPDFNIEKLINLDELLRKLKLEVEQLRHKKNELARKGQTGITQELREQSQKISKELKEKEANLEVIQAEFNNLYLRCPNIIEPDVPAGNKEANILIKEVNQKPKFDFEILGHIELGKINNWFDFEAAAKMTGAQFALYKGQAVKLIYALMIYMLNNNIKHGFYPILPPYLVNEAALIGASNFPRFKDEVYAIPEDKLYLTPTSEVNLTSIYREEILMAQDLPIRMTSWTSCFRREAGGYGAAERGLIRMHQFEKCELYSICEPKDTKQEQERMLECAESILKALNLHYRIMLLAAQDTSFASAKTYDIEVWMPKQKIYKEVSSVSNCTDFQARRSEIRYRLNSSSKTQLVYTLNGSSLALPRLMVALMETYQQADNTIKIPDILKSVNI